MLQKGKSRFFDAEGKSRLLQQSEEDKSVDLTVFARRMCTDHDLPQRGEEGVEPPHEEALMIEPEP